jgi:type II secretion system protein N
MRTGMNRFWEILRKGWTTAQKHAGGALAGIGLFLLAFLLGIYLFFPVTAAQHWFVREIETRTPISLQIGQLSLRPLFTFSSRDAAISCDNGTQPPVMLDELRLKPLWTTLLTDDPGLSVEASLRQGHFAAAIRRSGEFALHAEEMKLTEVPISQEPRTRLSGTIVKGELRGSFPPKKTAESRLALEMDNATLTVMGQPLALGKVSAQGSGQGNTLHINTLTASGGDLAITGNGTLLLGASAAASRINLDLTLRPTPAVAALLDLVARKQPDNSYRLRLGGLVNKPTVEPASSGNKPRGEPSDD